LLDKEREKIDIGIITALPLERDAILKNFNLERKTVSNTVFFYGKILHKPSKRYFKIVLYFGDVGNVESSIATKKLIDIWNPSYIILLGIAGGISQNHVNYGDIVIAKEIVYFTIEKDENGLKQYRPLHHQTDPELFDCFKNFPSTDKDKKWIKNIKITENQESIKNILKLNSLEEISPNIYCGSIFSGDKIIKDSNVVKELLKLSPKGLGIEMESWGSIMASFKDSNKSGFIAIRGISDLADKPSKKKWDKLHDHAANIAAIYLKSFLENGPLYPLIESEIQKKIEPKFIDYEENEFIKYEEETLISNLIEINKPDFIWSAETQYNDYKVINRELEFSIPYILHEGKLISFFSFEESNPLNKFININTIEHIIVKDWCENEILVDKIIHLFNKVIFVLCKLRSLFHDPYKIRWYYPNYERKDIIKKSWKRKMETERTVLKYYESYKAFYHPAFSLRAKYLDDQLYFCLLPKKIFTEDGFTLVNSEKGKVLEEKFRKNQMNYNQGSLNLTEFWFHYLFKHKEIFMDPLDNNQIIKKKRLEIRKILSKLEIRDFKPLVSGIKPIEKPIKKTKKKPSGKKSAKLM